MNNYKIDNNNIIISPVLKGQKKALKGWKQTCENICPGMIDNLNGTFSNPKKDLKKVKQDKKQELRDNFNKISTGFIIINNISYYGGYESAQKLDAKRRLIVESGGTEVKYFDTNRDYHNHTLKEALDVCVTVAMKYEADLEYYNNKLKEIDSKQSVDDVENIEW